MEAKWYYASGKQKMGPFSFTQLQQLALAGTIQPTSMVWQEGTQKWQTVSDVPGLFPSVAEGICVEPVSSAPTAAHPPTPVSNTRAPVADFEPWGRNGLGSRRGLAWIGGVASALVVIGISVAISRHGGGPSSTPPSQGDPYQPTTEPANQGRDGRD